MEVANLVKSILTDKLEPARHQVGHVDVPRTLRVLRDQGRISMEHHIAPISTDEWRLGSEAILPDDTVLARQPVVDERIGAAIAIPRHEVISMGQESDVIAIGADTRIEAHDVPGDTTTCSAHESRGARLTVAQEYIGVVVRVPWYQVRRERVEGYEAPIRAYSCWYPLYAARVVTLCFIVGQANNLGYG